MVTVSKENINLQLLLIFYSITRFVFETVFQNNLQRTGVGSCYRLVTYLSPSLMFLAIYIWFCSSGLKQFGKFQNHTAWIWKQWLGSLALKIIFCTTRVRDETFRNGKRYEDKIQSFPSPYKVWENFFVKKLCIREQMFWGKFMGGCFTQWLMIRSCKEGEKSTLKIADWIWKTPYSDYSSGVGDFMQSLRSFLKKI